MGRFLFIANDRALDFINTAFAGGDTVPDLAAFVRWLEAARLLTPDEAHAAGERARMTADPSAIERVRSLRSAMRRSVEAVAGGAVPEAGDLAIINAPLRHAPRYDELRVVDGSVESVRRVITDDPLALLSFVADAARELFTRKNVRAIRRCANDACTHVFYDASKNGTRRWCSMSACGNREKVAALRSRRRAG